MKVIVHVGGAKTGSSAIQTALKQNTSTLAQCGIAVPMESLDPDAAVSGNHVWFLETLRQMPVADAHRQLRSLIDLTIAAHGGEPDKLVLSAENLSNIGPWPEMFAGLRERFELEVVLYVRRQDDFLLSAWQQWHVKRTGDFWAWLVRHLGATANWRDVLEMWERISPARIIVRVFERPLLVSGDVVSDFCEIIGFPGDGIERSADVVNPSYNAAVVEFARGNRHFFKDTHDNDYYNFIRALTGRRHLKNSRESTLTLDQRLAILSHYESSNRWVQEKYKPRPGGDGSLFAPPKPGDFFVPSEAQIEEQKLNLLMDLVYSMHRRNTNRGQASGE